MSEYEAVVKAVDTIMSFLYTHEKSSTTSMWESDIDGTTLKTDWGYFEQGLNEIKWYCTELESNVMPSADRPQGWIPCSERLPKENTEVLMSLEWGIDIGEYRNGDWHSEWINYYDDGDVLAWMPLPEPWKGADDE